MILAFVPPVDAAEPAPAKASTAKASAAKSTGTKATSPKSASPRTSKKARAPAKAGKRPASKRAPEPAPPQTTITSEEPAVFPAPPAPPDPGPTSRRREPSPPAEPGVSARLAPGPAPDSWLELEAGLHLFRRDFVVSGAHADSLPAYHLDPAPAPAVAATLFPGEGLLNLPRALGAKVAFEQSLGLTSAGASPGGGALTLPTRTHALRLEALGRLRLARFELTGGAGYSWRGFSISGAPGSGNNAMPAVSYHAALVSAAVRVILTERVFLSAHGDVRKLLSLGELGGGNWFPDASGYGAGGGAGLGLQLGPVEMRAGMAVERYFVALGAEDSGSAGDRYLGFQVGAAWRI